MAYQLSDQFVASVKRVLTTVIIAIIALCVAAIAFLNQQITTLDKAVTVLSEKPAVKVVVTPTASPSATLAPTKTVLFKSKALPTVAK